MANPPVIFVSEASRFSPVALRRLQSVARVELADVQDQSELIAKVRSAQVLWVRLRNRIDAAVMDAGEQLRAIATPTTGLNHVDVNYARGRGIEILSLRGETGFLQKIHATGEHTLALILALLRHVPASANHVAAGGWNRDLFRGCELYGKTAGIVGYGRVGRMVAEYLRAFGMRVVAADPAVKSAAAGVEMMPLGDLLAQADVVTLHVSLRPETNGFFGKREFARMKAGAWFVNTSRGELVDESALLDSLASGRLAGAALDVLCDERSSGMNEHPLVVYARGHENLLITPHIGGCTVESMEQTEEFLAEKVIRFLETSVEPAIAGIGSRKGHV